MADRSPRGTRRSRQAQAAATHEQLLAAAREIFETQGYRATTVASITKAANTAHGTFYLYFRNKEDAFTRVVEQVSEELYRQTGARWARDHPYEAIEVAIHGFLEGFVAHCGLWRSIIEASLENPNLERMWLEVRRRFVDRIARNLERLRETGAIRPLDIDVTAHALGSMVEWYAFTHFVLGQPPVTDGSFDAAVRTLTDLWFNAVHGGGTESAPDRR